MKFSQKIQGQNGERTYGGITGKISSDIKEFPAHDGKKGMIAFSIADNDFKPANFTDCKVFETDKDGKTVPAYTALSKKMTGKGKLVSVKGEFKVEKGNDNVERTILYVNKIEIHEFLPKVDEVK